MITITSNDILEYMPVIQKYSGYDRDNTVFDKYISLTSTNLRRLLKSDGIDVDDPLVEADENMRQLFLSYVVYKFYHGNSYNVEKDRPMVEDLLKVYTENYGYLIKSTKQQVYSIITEFLG